MSAPILIEFSAVEDMLKTALMLSPGQPVLILRKGDVLLILTELGNIPMILTAGFEAPQYMDENSRKLYEALKRETYLYLAPDGSITFSGRPPSASEAMSTGVGIVAYIDGLETGCDAVEKLKVLLGMRKKESR